MDRVGILVLAHGGTRQWNEAVEEAVAPLEAFCPVTVAFGMAQRNSLQAGVEELEKAGVSRIAVVGLFISPHSFRHQTEYLLGLRADPPEEFLGPHAHMLDLLTTRRC
jgi:sirohydrochlorin cobaltochelatase